MEATQYGLAFYKGKWRYIDKYAPVKKGKSKGCYWVFFRNEGKRVVPPEQIKRMPSPPGQLRILS